MSYFKLKSALWILVVLLVGCKQQAQDVQTGFAFDCAKHGKYVSCWGIWSPEAFNNRVDPPIISFQTKNEYVDPKISVGAHHYCVLDQGQVECFLNNEFGQTDVPELSNPYEIAVGGTHSCALDDTGVVCWGDLTEYLYPLPENVQNPRNLVSGAGHICFRDDNGVHCAGVSVYYSSDPRPTEDIPEDSILVSSSASSTTCAYSDEWVCWGGGQSFNPPEGMDDLKVVAPGFRRICGASETEVVCWGEDSNLPYDFPDSFSNPTDISLGMHDGKICVNSDAGVQCWYNDYPVPWYL